VPTSLLLYYHARILHKTKKVLQQWPLVNLSRQLPTHSYSGNLLFHKTAYFYHRTSMTNSTSILQM
jgi:hypothetical protein